MLELVSTLTVTLHLLAADLAAVGPLVCLWLEWRAARGDRTAHEAERGLLRDSIAALCIAMLLGAAALGLLWMLDRESWFAAARQLPAQRYWFGLIELVFSLVCMAAALLLWRRDAAAGFTARFSGRFILLALAGTNLAYHFPTLFSAIGVLSTRPESWGQKVKFIQLLADPEVLARTLHHLLAATAVTGGALMLGSLRWWFEEAESARRVAIWGGRIALAASVLQLLAGMHLLFQLPPGARQQLMGEDLTTSLLFAGALLATVMLLHRLAAISFGDVEPRQIVATLLLIVLTILLMAATRQRTRTANSRPARRAACGSWVEDGKLIAARVPPVAHNFHSLT